MAKIGGPRKDRDDAGTRLVRVNGDMAEMIGWIVELKGGSSAKLLDPLIRKGIKEEFATIAREVEVIKKARSKHRPGAVAEGD
jgi:hypothetical protein